jgi:hypothetical protein
MSAPTGFTLVTATKIQDASGRLLAFGRVTFFPVNNYGKPISALAGGGGGLITQTGVVFLVVAGVITTDLYDGTPQIADSALTTPANICYRISVTDATGAEVQGPGYGLQQPTGASFNLDTALPNQPMNATIQTGPAGATGPIGATTLIDTVTALTYKLAVISGALGLVPANVIADTDTGDCYALEIVSGAPTLVPVALTAGAVLTIGFIDAVTGLAYALSIVSGAQTLTLL